MRLARRVLVTPYERLTGETFGCFGRGVMLDTIKLRSPVLTVDQAVQIEQSCVRRSAVQIATGLVEYSLTTGLLEGTFDHRVSVRIDREEYPVIEEETGVLLGMAQHPRLLIEGSVHKALLGHNVFGGPLEPVPTCCWFVDLIARLVGCPLADGLLWEVLRLDVAEVYELPSSEAVHEFTRAFALATFPRRKAHRYDGSILFPGATTGVKAYHKGPEFKVHDFKRLQQAVSLNHAYSLQDRADKLLRWEVEIKARKLRADYGHQPLVSELSREYVELLHDREVFKLLKEGAEEMETVRKHREVRDRLHDVYGSTLANMLFGTWLQFAALGEKVALEKMSRPTFYRHRKQLIEAGVTWNSADVHVDERPSLIPAGFSPVRSDPRRLTEEAPEVVKQLEPFRSAA